MKLGIDIHGVLDANPTHFIQLAKETRADGGEVYIITGSSHDKDLTQLLLNFNDGEVFWDHVVSIQDELLKMVRPEGINRFGRPYWSDLIWDSFKGNYCAHNKIDLHYDDCEQYIKYFSTPVILYTNK